MNKIAILSIIAVLGAVFIMQMSPGADSQLESDFQKFISEYGRSYNSQPEYDFRMQIFKENLEKAAELQKKSPLATFGVTQFSDWTHEEFVRLLGDRNDLEAKQCTYSEVDETEVNGDSVDWESGFVSIQNQGACGSCWSFAAAATFEFYWNRKTGNLIKASEQQLVSCDTTYDSGCNGGLANNAYYWLASHAFCTGQSYPYEAKDTSCKTCSSTIGKTQGCQSVTRYSESALKAAVFKGPISVSVDASVWHSYTGGILTEPECGHSTNHAVVIVGYNTDSSGIPYYTVRNSWGKEWGENGHIRMKAGTNTCDITRRPGYPII